MSHPSAEAIRVFVPASDYVRSQNFYRALGFTPLFSNTEVTIYQLGQVSFILQNFFVKEFADNLMLQLRVADLDAWWAHIDALDLPGQFATRPPIAPATQNWGGRVAMLFDPSGVLWQVTQA